MYRRRRVTVALLAALVILALPVGWSYAGALAAPGNDGVMARTVEWLRDNGGGGAVDWAERQWFGMNQPPEGGTPDAPIDLPQAVQGEHDSPAGKHPTPNHLTPPAPLVSPAVEPVPNEGVWRPTATVDGIPALYATEVRPDDTHTSLLVGVTWMDPNLLKFRQFPGAKLPGGSWATPDEVPPDQQQDLVAAFNGGFRMEDSQGGFYLDGKAKPDLQDGIASLVIKRDGTPVVCQWGRDQQMAPDVASVRQNLSLLVDDAKPSPDIADTSSKKWGVTLGNKIFDWRSGIGTTAQGALVWVGGPGLSVSTLADTLVRAGAVRAMELDINPDWVTFNLYNSTPGGVTGTRLLPNAKKPGDRYLSADSRDFVAAFARAPA